MTTRAWVNGRLLAADEPALLANDHGLTVGDGVFETCKVVRGEVFALTRHLDRLARSAAGLALPEPDLDRIRAGIVELLAAEDPIEFGRLRITVTGGAGPLGSERIAGAGTCVLQVAAQAPPPADQCGRRRAVGAQRAQRCGRHQDHVVRRERRRPGLCQGPWCLRGAAGQHRSASCARAPAATSSSPSTGSW